MSAFFVRKPACVSVYARILKVCNSLIFSVLCDFMPKTPLFYPLKPAKCSKIRVFSTKTQCV